MMNKKGFTYFELLAALAIVGVIIIFARPVVNRIMGLARKNSFTSTNNELVNNLSDLCVLSEFDNNSISNTYSIVDGKVLGLELSLKGELPNEGTIIINNECNISISTVDKNNEYCATKNFSDSKIKIGKVDKNNCVAKDIQLALVNETLSGTCYTYNNTSDGVVITGYKYDQEGCSKDLVIPTTIGNNKVYKIEPLAFVDPESIITIFEFDNDASDTKVINAYDYKKGMTLKDNSYMRVYRSDANKVGIVCNDGINNYIKDIDYVHDRNDGYNYCYSVYEGEEENRYSFTGLDFSKAIYLKNIPYGVAANSNIERLTLNDKIDTIGANAFKYNVVDELEIPDSLKSIGAFTFLNNSISKVDLKNVSDIGIYSFTNNIIDEFSYKKINNIPSYAFENNRIHKLELSRDTSVIGSYAFSENPLSYVKLTSSIKRVEDNAFNNSVKYEGSIKVIELDDNLEYLGEGAFRGHGAEKVSLSYKITDIKPYTFASNGALNEVRFSKITTNIGDYAFYNNNIISLEIPNTVTNIGKYAFVSKKNTLENLTLGDKLVSIGKYAFINNKISKLVIPDSVITIGEGAFKNSTSLKDLTLSNNLNVIEKYTFENNGIVNLTIPDSVNSINEEAFRNEVKSISNISFGNNLTYIGDYAFYNNSLKSISIPNSVSEIGEFAFMCIEPNILSKLELSNRLNVIANSCFYNNIVKELVIPNGVVKIEDYAFASDKYSNDSLNKVTLNNGLQSIGASAFLNNGIKKLIIPNSVNEIGEGAFYTSDECLEELQLGTGLSRIKSKTFSKNKLEVINIPNNINYIESEAFTNGRNIKTINIGNGIKKIDSDAFRGADDVIINIDLKEGSLSNTEWGIINPDIKWKEGQE